MAAGPANGLIYGRDDRPPLLRNIVYGLQWLVVFVPMLTMVSVLAADVLGLDPSAKAAFFQRLLLVTGGTMMVQTLAGHRLPIIDGPAAVLVISLATLAPAGMSVVGGGMMAGAFVVLLCGLLGLMKYIAPLFTDRVVGVILLLIGLAMLPFLLPMMQGADAEHPHGRPLVMALSLGLVLLISLMMHHLRGFKQSLSIFWGVAAGSALFAVLGLVDASAVSRAAWLRTPSPWLGSRPEFHPGAIISFSLAYLAVMVNAVGSLYAVAPLVDADRMDKRMNRSMVVTGLSGLAGGALGVVGTVPFSISPGFIAVTRVGSRYPLAVCGLVLAGMAFLGKLTAVLSSVPDAVVGAALLTAMSAGMGVAIEILTRDKSGYTNRDYLVVGLPVLMGTAAGLLPSAFLDRLPDSIRPLAGNGLIVGVVAVLLLEHVVFRRKE